MNAGPVILAPDGSLAALHAVRGNWYEGSRWSPNRSWVWFPVQDARKDLDRYTRYELSKHARYLFKNSPLVRGLIERLVTLTVGCGFHPVFKSSSPEWNARAREFWRLKSRSVHLGSRASFLQYQRAVARARFVDGECFSILTEDTSVEYTEKVQGIEAELVANVKANASPTGTQASDIPTSIDGLNINHQGIVVSYTIKGVDEPYDAESIVHHFTPGRLGQYRGETILAAAINTARDVDDILALEKQCVKDASSKQDIIKTKTGQLDPESFRKVRYSTDFPTGLSLPGDQNASAKQDYYKIHFGAAPIVLQTDDEYTPYKPDRPGSAWQGFMDFLSETICLSTGIPPSILLPVDGGGTDVRRDLDVTQRVVDPWQADIALELDSILEHLMSGEIREGSLRKGCPEDWQRRSWYFPQKLNVDRGQAKEDRADVAAGLMSLEEYHARYSENAQDVEVLIVEEAKRRRDAIKAAGFASVREFVEVLSLNPQMMQAAPQAGTMVPKKGEE